MLPENASAVVLACCVMHNFLQSKTCHNYCPPGHADNVDLNGNLIAGAWRQDPANRMQHIDPTVHRHPTNTAASVRETFVDYLSNEGALPWQLQYVNRVR